MPDTLVPELASLLDFCSHSGRHLSLSDLLHNLELRVRRLLPCTTCAFFLDAGDHNLRIVHAGGEYRDKIEGFVTDLGKGISGWVAAYGRPAINARPGLEFKNLGGDLCRLSDSLVVPLEHAGNSLGTISLYSASARAFSAVHLQLLQFVASQAAPVVLAVLARNALPPGEVIDPVTGCHSIQHLAGAGSRIIAAAEPRPFALIHLGLKGSHDDLPPGDSILREVAACLRSEIRENDILARFGEAGFLLLLATVRKEKAQRWAARMQEQISTAQAGVLRDVSCKTTVAAFPDDGVTLLDLLYTACNAAAITQGSPSQPCREHP
jgi:GGDEF domain-containing protein